MSIFAQCGCKVFYFHFLSVAFEGQVLELPVLQVYLHIRRDERSDDGRGRSVGRMVHHSRIPSSPYPAVQG